MESFSNYTDFVTALYNCSYEEGVNLLQFNEHLLDRELLVFIEDISENLKIQGDEVTAYQLSIWANCIAGFLDYKQQSVAEIPSHPDLENDEWQEYFQYLNVILGIVLKHPDNPEFIRLSIARDGSKLNLIFAHLLPQLLN
ncbi:MAG: hypothetical protein ACLFT0_16560, partial [Spirulinaceae cyanobacterium]